MAQVIGTVEKEMFVTDKDPHIPCAKNGIDDGFDPAMLKALKRKIDWRLVTPLCALNALSLIDRANIALAAEAGMSAELHLTVANRYSHAILAFFPPYIALELFSNIGMRKVGARWWLPSAGVIWGLTLIATAFVRDWKGLTALRTVLGVAESTLFPGTVYLLSCWYPRKEIATRMTFFVMTGSLFSAFGSILAYALSRIHTGAVLSGWRWIYMGEGLLSLIVAVPCYWFIVDFPSSHRCTFLTEDQKDVVATRIDRDRADAEPDDLTLTKVAKYAADIKLWGFAYCYCSTALASYCLGYFTPRIIASMGFHDASLYLLIVPPALLAICWGFPMARWSDKTGLRLPFIIGHSLAAVLGLCLFAFLPTTSTGGRYFGIFLSTAGLHLNIPLISAASQTAIRGQSKRAYTSALVVGFGGVGGILSTFIFRQKDSPRYAFGVHFILVSQVIAIAICLMLGAWFRQCNRIADCGRMVIEGHRDFRYQI